MSLPTTSSVSKVQSKVRIIFDKLDNLKEISSLTKEKSIETRNRLIGDSGKCAEVTEKPEPVGILGRIIDDLDTIRERLIDARTEQDEVLKEIE